MNAKVSVIECVLDLEKLKEFVTAGSDSILNNIFDDNT